MPRDETIEQYREELSGDEEIESTFQQLRRDGHSRLEALRVILDLLDVSLSEAKTILHANDTWAEAREDVHTETNSAEDRPDDPPVPPAPA